MRSFWVGSVVARMQNGYVVDLFGPPQLTSLFASRPSTMPKKGKGGKDKATFLIDDEALSPFGVQFRDIINTPLGVQATVVGVKSGQLWLEWPGKIQSPASPAPEKVKTKAELQAYGYSRRPQSAHIQRAIDERLSVRATPLHPPSKPCFAHHRSLAVVSRASYIRRLNISSVAMAFRGRRRPLSGCLWDRTARPALPRLPLSPPRIGRRRRQFRAMRRAFLSRAPPR